MADNTIDTLSIQINSSSRGASNAIDTLCKRLEKLSGSLNNYSRDTGQYGRAMQNLQDGLEGLNRTINGLETKKLADLAKSISSLTSSAGKLKSVFGDIGLSRAARDAQAFEKELDKAAEKLMSMYKTSPGGKGDLKEGLSKFANNLQISDGYAYLNDDAKNAMLDIDETLSIYATKSGEKTARYYSDSFIEYLRTKSGKVKLPFTWRDIAGDWESARKQLSEVFGVGGWTFDKNSSAGDIAEFARQMNEDIGTQFDIGNEAIIFEQLYEALQQAKQGMLDFSSEVDYAEVDVNELKNQLIQTVVQLNAFKEAQAKIPVSAQEESPFGMLSSSLKQLEGIQIPDLTGLASLSANVGKLANKGASRGIQLLPSLVGSLQSLNQLNGINIPDLTGLAELAKVIGTFGTKKPTAAASNMQSMVSALQQLSQLSGMTFPDGTALMSLANAFSVMGRATSGRAIQNIPQLANAFRNLLQTLSTAPRISSGVVRLAEALARLSSNGAKVGSASRSLTTAFNRINTSSRPLTGRIITFGKSLLASATNADRAGSRYTTLASKIGLLYAKYWMLLRVVNMFNRVITPASNLIEVQNVVDTTFGKMSDKLDKFAKNSIKSFGLSELAAKQYASRFQAMGTAMGITGKQVADAHELISKKANALGQVAGYDKASKSMADMSINLTKLAADMASFYDVSSEDVAKQLQSGIFAGQSRALRAYGVDLTQATLQEWALAHGINEKVKSMTQAEKTMLRYQFVMSSLSKSQGDFARTSGRMCAA